MAETIYIKEPPYGAGDRDPGPPPAIEELAAWEVENGRLPDDYRTFILRYKGGTVYPGLFRHNTKDPTDFFIEANEIEAVDDLFHGNDVLKAKSTGSFDMLSEYDLIAIGYDTSGSRICLSVAEEDFGAIKWWWRNMESWEIEDDGPRSIGTIAPSFREFLYGALFDDGSGLPRWRLPSDLSSAKKIEI